MRPKMSLKARKELIEVFKEEYSSSTTRRKRKLLDSFIEATGYGRKYAIKLLNSETGPNPTENRCRARKYDLEAQDALMSVWKAANRICSKRLVPFIPTLIDVLEKKGHLDISNDTRAKLLSISPATVDRILKQERQKYGRRYGTTKPGSILKKQIQIRTFADWKENKPGFIEADLVAHCGGYIRGQYLHTFTLTDIHSGWTECRALGKRGESETIEHLVYVQNLFPFPVLGLDTDNGTEFINKGVLQYCLENEINFTRSREYRKNDQAHVEEKNGSIVRKLVGYDRYEGDLALNRLSRLYALSRLYFNFFQPSLKLLTKRRIDGKTKKIYDTAKTPYQRIIDSPDIPVITKKRLQRTFEILDPILLLNRIEEAQTALWKLANKTPESIYKEELPCRKVDDQKPIKPKRSRSGRKKGAEHTWRNRKDPFEDIWPEINQELERNPSLTAGKLVKHFSRKYPTKIHNGHQRTMHRRLKEWRMKNIHYINQFNKNGVKGLKNHYRNS